MQMKASIVTTCKGRRHHLEQTVPLMLAQEGIPELEVIVVDYGCPDKIHEYCDQLADPRLKCVIVKDNVDNFDPSRARNCGGVHASGDAIAFVDGDILLPPDWLHHCCAAMIDDNCVMAKRDGREQETTGTCVVISSVYKALRGYGEDLIDWGWHDCDFHNRCEQLGDVYHFPVGMIKAIHNDVEERTRFYQNKQLYRTNERNKRIAATRKGIVNPDGYGQGDIEVRCYD